MSGHVNRDHKGLDRVRMEQLSPVQLVDIAFALDQLVKVVLANNDNLARRLPVAENANEAECLVSGWTRANMMVAQETEARLAAIAGGRPRLN